MNNFIIKSDSKQEFSGFYYKIVKRDMASFLGKKSVFQTNGD